MVCGERERNYLVIKSGKFGFRKGAEQRQLLTMDLTVNVGLVHE